MFSTELIAAILLTQASALPKHFNLGRQNSTGQSLQLQKLHPIEGLDARQVLGLSTDPTQPDGNAIVKDLPETALGLEARIFLTDPLDSESKVQSRNFLASLPETAEKGLEARIFLTAPMDPEDLSKVEPGASVSSGN